MSEVAPPLTPVNPATGEPLPPVPTTSEGELTGVVAAARAAQQGWSGLGVHERARRIESATSMFADPEIAETLAQTITQEMGKPIRDARAEVRTVVARTRGLAERAIAACQDDVAAEAGVEVVTQWRALGVAAVIAPWNYPLSTPHHLVISALLTGNACVLKPSEFTPRTGARYRELLAEVLPSGVLGIVQGTGVVGAALVASDVDMIAFTGSIATGQAIMRSAAGSMKRLVLELGGKDAMIVLPGADLDAAADHATRAALTNSGQVCVAAERLLVHRDVHATFLAKVIERVARLRVGDPRDEATDLGPMANAHQRDLVVALVEQAQAAGARVVYSAPTRGPGFFLAPFVVDGVTPQMALGCQETFGPVISVFEVRDAEEAVSIANSTHYGLGASVWGEPGPQLAAVAERLEAGMIGMNRGLSAAAGAPWVGWKMSGFGHSRSVSGMRQFMNPRTISRNVG